MKSAQPVREVKRDLEAGVLPGLDLGVGDRRAGIDVGRGADALPVGHRAAGRARCQVAVELPARAAVAVVVAGHDDRRLVAAREVPEPRERHPVGVHLRDQVGQQPLLLVGLRDRDLVEVDPVGLDVAGLRPEEQVVGADRRDLPVALLARPGRVALAGVDDRARQVVGERGRLAAVGADAAQGHGRVRASPWSASE